MNRITKNIIMIICIIALAASIIFTANYGKKHSISTDTTKEIRSNEPPERPDGKMGEPPEMNGEQPPEKPDGEPPENNSTEKTTEEKNTSDELIDTTASNTNTQPEMPTDGGGMEMPEGGMGEPPEKPDGEMGEPPEMGNGDRKERPGEKTSSTSTKLATKYYFIIGAESIALSSLIMYAVLSNFNKKNFKETFENNKKVLIYIIATLVLTGAITTTTGLITNKTSSTDTKEKSNGNNGPNQNKGNSNISYNASKEITESTKIENEEYQSEKADENAILASGDIKVDLSNTKVTKTGDSDGGDNTSFYGTNSAVLAKDGATVNIDNATIETNATGANGVFSYGGSATTNNSASDGTTVNISNSKITTSKGNSGGIMTTGGGTTNATNLTITTKGQSSAAIRSDRGGGTVNVDGGTYKTSGVGSPAIYSTADITVKNAELISTTSEGAIIEGKNSITLENVKLTDTHSKNVKSSTYKNIFIYQSMSGDAAEGKATFTAKDSTITTNKGDSIFVSNTKATINLSNNIFINNDKNGVFLRIQADAWGKEGSNGGNVNLNMTNQPINGDIAVDSISTLTINMKSSSYKGTIGSKESKEIKLKLDKDTKIVLTGDSCITSLENEDQTNSNIDFNGYKLYVNNEAIN